MNLDYFALSSLRSIGKLMSTTSFEYLLLILANIQIMASLYLAAFELRNAKQWNTLTPFACCDASFEFNWPGNCANYWKISFTKLMVAGSGCLITSHHIGGEASTIQICKCAENWNESLIDGYTDRMELFELVDPESDYFWLTITIERMVSFKSN